MTVTTHVEPMVREKVLSLLQQRKRVEWIAQAWGVPRPHVIQIGLDAGLRLRPREDIMTAAPPALDVDEDAPPVRVDAKGRPIVERAPETPTRLLPPAPAVVPEQRPDEEPPSDTSPKVTPVDLVKSRGARDAALAHNERVRKLGGRAAIVAWARANGHPTPPGNLGRVKNSVLDAYEKHLADVADADANRVPESAAENIPDFIPATEPPPVEEKPASGFEVFRPEKNTQVSEPPAVEEKPPETPPAYQPSERPMPFLYLGNIKRSVEHVARLCHKALNVEHARTDPAYRATLVALAEAHAVLDVIAALIVDALPDNQTSEEKDDHQ